MKAGTEISFTMTVRHGNVIWVDMVMLHKYFLYFLFSLFNRNTYICLNSFPASAFYSYLNSSAQVVILQ